MRVAPVLLTVHLLLGAAGLAAQAGSVAGGDAAWARRAEGHQGARAAAGPVDQAIAAYERAVREKPSLEAYWKLLRALHFKGEHVARTREEKQAVFGRGREVVEKALDLLSQRVGGRK